MRYEKSDFTHDHGYNEEKVAQHMPTENEIAGVSEAMKAAGGSQPAADLLAAVPL